MKWHFQKHDGFADVDQSSSAEAFVSGNLRDLATALVRESMQNVLDAKREDHDGPVRVRMSLGQVKPETADYWFDGLNTHLGLEGSGLPHPPEAGELCRTLSIEDFGTCGLTGDYTKPYREGEQNNFVNFLYHDGVTGKAGNNLGSRGVGKIVLLMASRARTKFAFTIRDDEDDRRPLLVGKNLLKFRTADDGQQYSPKSYLIEDWPTDAARQPVSDPDDTARFANDFALTRGKKRGLSVLIPYLDPTITRDDLRRAIVAEYHFAILAGRLVVELAEGDEVETFTPDHLPSVGDASVDAMIELSRWAVAHPETGLVTIAPQPDGLQRLAEELVPETVRESIGSALDARERVAVRMPLHVHPRDTEPVETFVTVYLEFAERQHDKPAFVREVLPVTDVRGAWKAAQVRALVVVADEPILKMLRAAEGANHTDWSPRTDQFKRSYHGRKGEIDFVASAVGRLIEIVRGQASEPVGGIATRFFSAAVPDAKPKTKGDGKDRSKGTEPDDVPDDLQPNPGASFMLVKNADGFTVERNPDRERPKRLTVRVAYDVLRGSPWSKTAYDTADFDLRKKRSTVHVVHRGVQLERPDPGNRLVIVPVADDFQVVVHGFDPNRDLIVDVRDTPGGKKKSPTHPDPHRKEADDDRATDQLHETQQADA